MMGARRPRRKSKPAPRDAATHRSDGGSLPFSPRCVSILYRSREARGFWPADRPATCRRQQGANASPETGTIGLKPSKNGVESRGDPRDFRFRVGGRGPETSRQGGAHGIEGHRLQRTTERFFTPGRRRKRFPTAGSARFGFRSSAPLLPLVRRVLEEGVMAYLVKRKLKSGDRWYVRYQVEGKRR